MIRPSIAHLARAQQKREWCRHLLPMYADFNEGAAPIVPTLAAQVSIEMGRPVLFGAVTAMTGAIGLSMCAALNRGRDSFYPAAAAGCAVTFTLEARMKAPHCQYAGASHGLGKFHSHKSLFENWRTIGLKAADEANLICLSVLLV
jgi:hypothetical protein